MDERTPRMTERGKDSARRIGQVGKIGQGAVTFLEAPPMNEIKDAAKANAIAAPAAPERSSLPAEATEPDTPPQPWEKVRQLALQQLDRFMALEPKVLRGDDPDAIHDIRVASRRLQQVLDLLCPAPRSGEIRRLRRNIRRCRRVLGEVRNCDVLLGRVEKSLARKRTARREAWLAFEQYLGERRAESFEKAIRKLSKANLADFYVRLRQRLAPNGAAPESGHGPHALLVPGKRVEGDIHERITQDLERFWQAFETHMTQSHQDPRASLIHRTRIASKRLRYLIEVIHAFEVPGSAPALAWLRALQQHLGDWHDQEVLEQSMIDMIARPEFLRDHLELVMGVEKLILRNRAFKKKVEEKYFRMTKSSSEYERVKEWVGYVLSSPPAALATA